MKLSPSSDLDPRAQSLSSLPLGAFIPSKDFLAFSHRCSRLGCSPASALKCLLLVFSRFNSRSPQTRTSLRAGEVPVLGVHHLAHLFQLTFSCLSAYTRGRWKGYSNVVELAPMASKAWLGPPTSSPWRRQESAGAQRVNVCQSQKAIAL